MKHGLIRAMNLRQACATLNISRNTLKRRIAEGVIEVIRCGGHTFIHNDVVQRVIDEGTARKIGRKAT